ncbi:MAG: ParB/RepB/Spo0J family partition protein [Gemmatimonadota bacterium]|nr:ParB/RepB/Spo0J family partition protein [Gemmatimonadota bacterium]MDH5283377.1 ParB/RepB/Spo0J family partition protein [Gemmatimonadota bacterium]
MSETKRLGRGLEALLGPVSRQEAAAAGSLLELPVGQIRPNPYQPRTALDEPQFSELVASIETAGLLQPVLVRRHLDGYQLIAGERRWRAAQKLGWQKIPAVIKDVDDRTLLTLALIENLQRDNLSAIEEARSYERLGQEFGLSHGEIAHLVGRDRSTVANALRLLKLPAGVVGMVDDGRLSEGHARALLGLSDPAKILRFAGHAVESGWSVRDLEKKVRNARPVARGRTEPSRQQSPAHRRVEEALRKRLGTDVSVTARRKGRGTIGISYYNEDDLTRLLELILGAPYDG